MSGSDLLTIGITGGSGFVGRYLARRLLDVGHRVVVLGRRSKPDVQMGLHHAVWQPDKQQIDGDALSELDAVIHLAGAGIADRRWTASRKQILYNSRVPATRFLHEALKRYASRCKVFVSASAIGYYGADRNGGAPFREADQPADDFIGHLCADWEAATFSTSNRYRTVALRTGIVLGNEGGALMRLAQPLSFGLRPILGNGEQMMSWIHLEDLAGIYVAAVSDVRYSGAINAVAPEPVSYRDMMHTLTQALGQRSAAMHVPEWLLRMRVGELAGELLKSCTVSADKLLGLGFAFQFPSLGQALRNLSGSRQQNG